MVGKKIFGPLLAMVLVLGFAVNASAEDQIKPILDASYNMVKNADESAGKTFFGLFPGFEDSLNGILNAMDRSLSFMQGLHWVFYFIVFVMLVSILIKVWERSDSLVINSVMGVALLLVLIHAFGVAIKVTILRFIIVLVLGIPGALLVLALHYMNWIF